ncbi:hypothetical protein [Bifidobacterium animalis]|uniref:hypothetical protein n=1 Tax=Bifidobacterium animalis TaxID=28025 RepID=UPI0012B69636|nr:hypothetical protein [Bifidobacterium animalis]
MRKTETAKAQKRKHENAKPAKPGNEQATCKRNNTEKANKQTKGEGPWGEEQTREQQYAPVLKQ